MTSPHRSTEHEPVADTEAADLLERVRDAVAVLAELPGAPQRLRVRAGDVEMELDWATPAPPPSTSPTPGAQVPSSPVLAAQPATGNGGRPSADLSIAASTVGTFYRCPEPGAEPFVQVGDRVKPGRQVAIIEVMKLMIPVEAATDAVVTDVLADDGQQVEYGQPLFALDVVS